MASGTVGDVSVCESDAADVERAGSWLTDVHVGVFVELLKRNGERSCDRECAPPLVLLPSVVSMLALCERGEELQQLVSAVGLDEKISSGSKRSNRMRALVVLPMTDHHDAAATSIAGSHWSVLALVVQRAHCSGASEGDIENTNECEVILRWVHLDSMHHANLPHATHLAKRLSRALMPTASEARASIQNAVSAITCPQQTNYFDCGAYACCFIVRTPILRQDSLVLVRLRCVCRHRVARFTTNLKMYKRWACVSFVCSQSALCFVAFTRVAFYDGVEQTCERAFKRPREYQQHFPNRA